MLRASLEGIACEDGYPGYRFCMENNNTQLTAWDHFVLRHRIPANLVVHFIAWTIYIVSAICAVTLWDWRWLFGLVLSGVIGALSHVIFKDGTIKVSEATFDPKTPFFVSMMFFKIFTGNYRKDIAIAEEKLRGLPGAT